MHRRLPLFPLGLVLFPGMLLPLHVFEERYQVLIRELMELPEDERRFGVVAIRQGSEVGGKAITGISALHEIGCSAHLRRVLEHDAGQFDLVTLGTQRYRLTRLYSDRPFLTADVEWLPDELGDPGEAAVLDPAVRLAFRAYVSALAAAGGNQVQLPELPADPLVLGHLVAATVSIDLADRQALLAAADGRERLRAELRLLRREAVLLRTLRAAPSPELTRGPVCAN